MANTAMKKNIIACWITAMRLPFTTVAIVPFAVGIAWVISDRMKFSITMSILGEIAVFCICVSCHLLGEIFGPGGRQKYSYLWQIYRLPR